MRSPPQREASATRTPCTTTGEKPCTATKTEQSQKSILKTQTGALYLNNFCKVFTESVTILFLVYVVVFGFFDQEAYGISGP